MWTLAFGHWIVPRHLREFVAQRKPGPAWLLCGACPRGVREFAPNPIFGFPKKENENPTIKREVGALLAKCVVPEPK
jgi:hypothetical protein